MKKVTPNAYRTAKRVFREAVRGYVVARAKALEACRVYRADRSGRNRLLREDALDGAWEARRWVYRAVATVRHCEARGIELGAAWSPAALKRHLNRKE